MPRKSRVTAYLLHKQDIPTLITHLKQVLTFYGPVSHNSYFRFDELEEGLQLRLDYTTTILPPKKFFIPPQQEIITFQLTPQLEWQEPEQDTSTTFWNGKRFVVFGVHDCDLKAISFNDKIVNLLYPNPQRTRHRQQGIIIGLHCLTPCPESFCKSMGSLGFEDSADLMLTDLGEAYYVKVRTDTGHQIVEYAADLFHQVGQKDTPRVEKILRERLTAFPDRINEPEKLPSQLDAAYEGQMWIQLGTRCFSCGSCTQVCPTCFCYDVQDKIDLSLIQGARTRTWDSCQLVDFALVAGGHNFRPTIASRVRFRFYHKFYTEPEQVNEIGCVGCGRCTRACPADIEMIEVLRNIQRGGN